MDVNQHDYTDIIGNAILSAISYFTRVVFGGDQLNGKQLLAFFVFCIGWVWLVSLFNVNRAAAGGLCMMGGLIIPSMIRAVIKGSKSAEGKVANTVEKNITNISDKVDDIAEVITGKNDDDKK